MGLKDEAMDWQQENQNKKLADLLGITYDEFTQLEYEFETDESNDGALYNYRLEFNLENSSKEILDKISRLEDGCRVYLMPGELDEEEPYDELDEESDL